MSELLPYLLALVVIAHITLATMIMWPKPAERTSDVNPDERPTNGDRNDGLAP